MADTLKLPGQEPKRDLTGTTVHIAEYDRVSLQVIHRWPIQEYERKADATQARQIVIALLDAQFPDPAHTGPPPAHGSRCERHPTLRRRTVGRSCALNPLKKTPQ